MAGPPDRAEVRPSGTEVDGRRLCSVLGLCAKFEEVFSIALLTFIVTFDCVSVSLSPDSDMSHVLAVRNTDISEAADVY